MELSVFLLCAAAVLLLLALAISFLCFRIVFYASRKHENLEEISLPKGKVYEPYHEQIIDWTKRMRALPQQWFSIRSFDGLMLRGRYFEYEPGAPIELMIHGYHGTAERDMSAGIFRSFSVGHSAFLVDQRASGYSDGHVISFGNNESRDCLRWVDFLVEHFGPEVKIMLSGISMGAATALIAAGQPLPENVIGVLADCGFTSAKAIICTVMRKLHLPPQLLYPFVRLGARLYGGFSLEERSPLRSLAGCKVPVIFYHGDTDDLVPCRMSAENHAACPSPKKLVTVPGAGHGLCFMVDQDGYLRELLSFCKQNGIPVTDNGLSKL
jgi:pimeloyl-ACP methyl ester carboxylesterase